MLARRLPLLLLGAVALIVGMVAGVARLGWDIPVAVHLQTAHGPLMVAAFLGTVIGLERAVALASGGRGEVWPFAAPALSGAGGIALIASVEGMGATLLTAGAGVLAVAAWVVVYRQTALFTIMMALAATALLLGNAVWLSGAAVAAVVPAWGAFLALTIAGERVELARFAPPSPAKAPLAAVPTVLILLAALAALFEWPQAGRAFGLGLVTLAAWLGAFDIAYRTVRQSGLTRYMAVCLLGGYFWLAAAGVMAMFWGLDGGGPVYDAILHALFVGFVFAMIFGHAPVILPAVLGVRYAYHPVLYVVLGLLHLSLVVRVGGDLGGVQALSAHGGALNMAAIVLFLLVSLVLTVRGSRLKRRPEPPPAA